MSGSQERRREKWSEEKDSISLEKAEYMWSVVLEKDDGRKQGCITKVKNKRQWIENRKILEKINEMNWFFERINKINKLLVIMIKQKKTQISNIRNEKGDVTVESTDIKKGSYGNIINNFIQRYITWMKLTNTLKKTNYQSSFKKK